MTFMLYFEVATLLVMLVFCQVPCAASQELVNGSRLYKDIHGSSYKRSGNLFRDNDGNGVLNLYQKSDNGSKKKHLKHNRTNTGGNRHGYNVQKNFK